LPWISASVRQKRPAHAAADQRQREDDAGTADRDVEPEHRWPAPLLDEHAAEHRSGRGGGRRERAEQAGREALAAGRERLQE